MRHETGRTSQRARHPFRAVRTALEAIDPLLDVVAVLAVIVLGAGLMIGALTGHHPGGPL